MITKAALARHKARLAARSNSTVTHRRGQVTNLLDPKVVQAFLTHDRDNWQYLKTIPRKKVEELVLPEFDNFHTNPWLHQLVCLALGISFKEFMFLLDMGLGKTSIILNLFFYHMLQGNMHKGLVLVPSAVNIETWARQIKRHRPELSFTKLIGSQDDRFRLLEEPTDLYLLNYAGLMVYMAEMTQKKKNDKIISKMTPHQTLVKNFLKRFDGVAFDEAHLLGNPDSLLYRLCRRLSRSCDVRYSATGTPFGREPSKLWSQLHLIDHGETLGETLALFRQAFYDQKPRFWGGVDWSFDNKKETVLHNMLQHRSIRYEDMECQDLPPMAPPEHLAIELPAEQRLYYSRVLQKIKEQRGDYKSLESSFIRMRQITAGFLGFKNEDGDRLEVRFKENPKIEYIKTLLECVPVGSKVVIFHEYQWSGRFICEALTELKIKFVAISGLVKGSRQKIANYNQYLNDSKTTVLVANTVSVGTGVDELQMVSRFGVFYELPTDPLIYRQAIKRLHRPGQQGRVYFYILEAENTVDETAWESIVEGQNLFAAICTGPSVLEQKLNKPRVASGS